MQKWQGSARISKIKILISVKLRMFRAILNLGLATIASLGAVLIISCTRQDIVTKLFYFAATQIVIALVMLIGFFWRMRVYLKTPFVPRAFLLFFLGPLLLHVAYLTAPLFFVDNRLAKVILKLGVICAN